MQMSPRGLQLTMDSEGLSTVAYRDGDGIWTIGYGHTNGVKKGDTCTPDQALAFLKFDMGTAEVAVARLVQVALEQWEADALNDFVFNLGAGALGGSTLLRKLNGGDRLGAAAEFPRWVHDGLGNVEPGLVTRRNREQMLFQTGDWK